MTFAELKEYVVEAIGEEVISVDKLIAGVRSGFGDMTHRGYRQFKNIFLQPKVVGEDIPFFDFLTPGMCIMNFPIDALETLYIKVYFSNKGLLATKLALTNPSIQSKLVDGAFRTNFAELDYETAPEVIFYKKADLIFVEWDYNRFSNVNVSPTTIEIGYYEKLPIVSKTTLREMAGTNSDAALDIGPLEVPIKDDYANVLVNWMIYYVALSQDWEQERLTILKNEYKYSMQDLLATKNKEDLYDETTNIQKIDGVI